MTNTGRYLKRLDGSLEDKRRILDYIRPNDEMILDVGCASGALTLEFARSTPSSYFLGIDIDPMYVALANSSVPRGGYDNVGYQHMYLRDLLKYSRRFDTIIFSSVLHEFFSYGEGYTSVVKALSDAYELLNPGGRIIIRDMMRPTYDESTYNRIADGMNMKISLGSNENLERLVEFEHIYGVTDKLTNMNHFLLKSLYYDNWYSEMKENYLAMNAHWYQEFMCQVLGMNCVSSNIYLLEFLEDNWRDRFNLSSGELMAMYSHGLLVFEKLVWFNRFT